MSRFKVKRLVAAARILAGLLAGAVLVFELLAANGGFHQALHQEGKAGPGGCVLCLFANGQVDSPESLPVATGIVASSFQAAPLVESILPVDFTYLLSPSRAPPALQSDRSVLA